VLCESAGLAYSYSLTKRNFYFVDASANIVILPVDININANDLFSLDIAVYFFLSFLGVIIILTVFLMVAYSCLQRKKVPFYGWEAEDEGAPLPHDRDTGPPEIHIGNFSAEGERVPLGLE
jgi:hypothetical protein